jgi:XTP/dITP diphosphohydrolase
MRVVLASQNRHKVSELRVLLEDLGWELVSLADLAPDVDPPEDQETFVDNALQKARFVNQLLGVAALADDSGLEVDALGGRPGVRSKRFSPEQTDAANNRFLLSELAGVSDRRAAYRCVLALVDGDRVALGEGRCGGELGHEPRGTGGFGYDPLFWPDETPGRTMAELTPEEKNAISHRYRAALALRAQVKGEG